MLGAGIAGYLIGKPGRLDRPPPPARTATTTQPATPSRPPASLRRRCRGRAGEAFRPIAAPASTAPSPRARPASTSTSRCRPPTPSSTPTMSASRPTPSRAARGRRSSLASRASPTPDYRLRLLPGFRARRRQAGRRAEVDVALGARPRVVTLPAGFYSAAWHRGRPAVTTVNISKLPSAVYRVNERALDKFIERLLRDLPRH